jgi:hypothetical protein
MQIGNSDEKPGKGGREVKKKERGKAQAKVQ